MFKRLAVLSLLFLMSSTHAVNLTLEDGCKLAKGSIAGAICMMSAGKTMTHFNAMNDDRKWNSRLYHALVAAGMSYSVSKLAPYARKSLQLKSSNLFLDHKTVSEARYASLIKAVLAGAVAGVSATEMVNVLNNGAIKNNNYMNTQTGSALNLAYAAYNSAVYSYSKVRGVIK